MKSRAWLRPVLVVVGIAIWLAVGGVGGQTFGVLSSVQENENSAFLPSSAESTQAAQAHAEFVPSDAVPGLFVIEGIGPERSAEVQAFVDEVVADPLEGDEDGRTVGDVLASEPQVVPAEDGEAMLVIFDVDAALFGETSGEATVGELFAETVRGTWAEQEIDADGYLTGAVGLVADLVAAFAGIDGILLVVALLVVLVILLIVYRSPVLPLLVLTTAMIALSAAIVLVYALAKADVITLNGQSQGIMFILVVGATTDYALLLVARYREELLHRASPYDAMWVAWRRSFAAIAASAGTVIAGLLVLLLSDLKSNASLGPAGAIGIASAFLAALTLLPALLLIGGKHARGVFWPARPRYLGDDDEDATTVEAVESRSGVWGRVSRAVDARPRQVWIGAGALLLVMAAGLTQLEADGLGDRDVFLTTTESVEGFDLLEEHFAAGATAPVRIIVDEADAESVLAAVEGVEGVQDAYLLTPAVIEGAPGGTVPEPPVVVDGRVEIDAVTEASSTARAAQDVVAQIRDVVHPLSEGALVGGSAAESLDTRLTTDRDIKVIIPVILVVIFVVLALLLRSLVAPAIIVLANILSFAAALGVSALVFTHVFGFPGMDPGTPLLGFVFLVALGVDYSIFLMSRAREEALVHGTSQGVRRALAVTGGVITSAGIVLAATFAALGVLPLIFLAQIAFIVGFGVLVDTFVVRSLLVPGLVSDIGKASWWPWAGAFRN
ncbi:MMPL family transporter [Demequina sp. TTPB684]|uniref:MMPL family transporter n=1 Tax=unclassified Demequina TaxID=2620311 RepID=UPI001CF4F2CE|nr:MULTISPECIES: MMPL family transporter [unclassified Demequina]MCB2413998.1 MMPL family transporter [Demequina sp. TTPB684]UPU89121.1 MMPL family transporter [Demequina sp. TMPB413]